MTEGNNMIIYDPWGVFKVKIVEDILKKFSSYNQLQKSLISAFTISILDKKYLEYSLKTLYTWMIITYKFIISQKNKKYIKTRVIQRITEERKINNLYECMSWYISHQVHYNSEDILKCITYDTFENKLPELLLRVAQDNVKFLEFQGRTINFTLSIKQAKIDGEDQPRQNDTIELYIETTDKNDKFLEDVFIPECIKLYKKKLKQNKYQSAIYENIDNKWEEIAKQPEKLRDTIILHNNDKDKLLENVHHFINNEQWYYDHGFPYSLGILLYGSPGCGKTSIIRLISHITKRNTHYLRLSQIKDEKEFNSLMKSVSLENTILVLEDIDCVKWVHDRSKKIDEDETEYSIPPNKDNHTIILQTNNENKDKENRMNLEALLSILDGMRTCPGQIVFMTTNHLEKLDPALIREGRMDIKMELKTCDREMIERLASQFYKKSCNIEIGNIPNNLSPAKVMNMFRKHRTDMDTALRELFENK